MERERDGERESVGQRPRPWPPTRLIIRLYEYDDS